MVAALEVVDAMDLNLDRVPFYAKLEVNTFEASLSMNLVAASTIYGI